MLCGLLCVISFVIPMYFLPRMQTEIQGLTLGPNVEVKKGGVGYLLCALAMAFLTVLTSIFLFERVKNASNHKSSWVSSFCVSNRSGIGLRKNSTLLLGSSSSLQS